MAAKAGRPYTTALNRHDRESSLWLTLLALCAPVNALILALSRPLLDPGYTRRR